MEISFKTPFFRYYIILIYVLKYDENIDDKSYNYNREFLLVCLLIKGKYIIINLWRVIR